MRLLFLPLLALLVLTSCNRSPAADESAGPLQIGSHAVSVVPPPEWEHFDYGERHHFRKDFERISIEDLGALSSDLNEAAQIAMTRLREDELRAEASRLHFTIDGRHAVAIDTWDRMSHQYRKRFVFVENKGEILAMYTMMGSFEAMEPAFDGLLLSLAFTDSLAR